MVFTADWWSTRDAPSLRNHNRCRLEYVLMWPPLGIRDSDGAVGLDDRGRVEPEQLAVQRGDLPPVSTGGRRGVCVAEIDGVQHRGQAGWPFRAARAPAAGCPHRGSSAWPARFAEPRPARAAAAARWTPSAARTPPARSASPAMPHPAPGGSTRTAAPTGHHQRRRCRPGWPRPTPAWPGAPSPRRRFPAQVIQRGAAPRNDPAPGIGRHAITRPLRHGRRAGLLRAVLG